MWAQFFLQPLRATAANANRENVFALFPTEIGNLANGIIKQIDQRFSFAVRIRGFIVSLTALSYLG